MKNQSRREFLDVMTRGALGLAAAGPLASLLAACQGMGHIASAGASLAASTGLISQSQAESISKSAHAVERSAQDITPEQEYYIGRAVGAAILNQYKPYDNPRVNRYFNLLGSALAQASDMPETYAGYHFLVLDSDDVNGLSAPGGLIFVTRGLMRCCGHEDAAAAILAHEIGHVQAKHGLKAIKTSRITQALTIIGIEGAKSFSGQELGQLTSLFEDTIQDVTGTLINTGYSRVLEFEADQAAAAIMRRVGYNPNALVDVLNEMKRRLVPGRMDFVKTHPDPQVRIDEIRKTIGAPGAVAAPAARTKRFRETLALL